MQQRNWRIELIYPCFVYAEYVLYTLLYLCSTIRNLKNSELPKKIVLNWSKQTV